MRVHAIAVLTAAAAVTLTAGSFLAAGQGVSGVLHQSAVEDGTPAYFKAIEKTAECQEPTPGLQAGRALFEGGKAEWALPGLADGEYTLCLFIDTDDNVQQSMGPTSGDYGVIKPLTVAGETTLDVAEDEWMRIP